MIVCARERSTLNSLDGSFRGHFVVRGKFIRGLFFFVDNFIVDLSRNAYLFVIVGSFLISLLVFMALGVNKNIIRHATIKSIGKMGVAIFFKGDTFIRISFSCCFFPDVQ